MSDMPFAFFLGYEYDYNVLDNRDHMYEIDANNNRTATETYVYDELSRLTNVTYKDNATQAYTFDNVGNRLTLTNQPSGQPANTTTYTYNSVNELTSGSEGSWSYDLNGNTLTDPERAYQWDVQNRLTSVTKGNTTVNFTYRTDGLRARKEVVGTSKIDYIYDGQTVIGEIHKNPSGTVTKKVWMTPGPNGYISRTETDPNDVVTNKEWFVYDGLGSTRAMVKPNAAGTDAIITARFDYDVYGKVRTSTGSTDNSFRYVGGSCGHPTDDETGLIYMRARYYDPGTGRFVGEDPGMYGVNWYSYASAEPINRLDLDGKIDWPGLLAGLGWLIAGLILLGVGALMAWGGANMLWDALWPPPITGPRAGAGLMDIDGPSNAPARTIIGMLGTVFAVTGIAVAAVGASMAYRGILEIYMALLDDDFKGGY